MIGEFELVEMAKCLHLGKKRIIIVITSTVDGNKPKGKIEHFYFERKYMYFIL